VHPTFCITCSHCFLRVVVDDDSTKTNVEPHPKIIHSISTRFIPFPFHSFMLTGCNTSPRILGVSNHKVWMSCSQAACVCVCFFLGVGWVKLSCFWWQKFWDYIFLGVIFLIKKLLKIWKFSQKNWGAKIIHKFEKIKIKSQFPRLDQQFWASNKHF
jgi:hypothetical protein